MFFLFICNGLVFAEKVSFEDAYEPMKSTIVYGVVDRVEDGKQIVIIVEELNLEFVVSEEDYNITLNPNDWVELRLIGDEIKAIVVDDVRTNEEKEKVKELIKQIKEKYIDS